MYLSSSHDVVILPKKSVQVLQWYMLEAEFKLRRLSPDGCLLPVSFSSHQALGGSCTVLVS